MSKTPVSEVARLLAKSKRPLFHVGQGVRHAEKEFFGLVEFLQTPFVTARNANDLSGWGHPLLVGRPGTFAQRGANFAVQTCDLYIAIGTRLSITQTGYNTKDYARNAQIIQVNIDQAELDKDTLRHPMNICMDAKEFLVHLQYHLQFETISHWDEWLAQCQKWKEMYPVCLPSYREEKEWVNSYVLIDVLSDCATAEDIIVTDMGFSFQNTHQGWKTKGGQRVLTNCGLAPMGWGLPAAIGASFGSGRRIILITGEGGLMMNLQELATVMHHKLNIKIFVLNNGGYLTIKQTQEFGFDKRLMGVNEDTGLSFPHFGRIARAHEIGHTVLWTHDHLQERIAHMINDSEPLMCEVMMSPDQPQAPRFINRRNADGTMNPTKLEDAWPFLDPTIIEQEMKI